MEKQMKLLTCLTKPLVLFALLLTIGIGEMWGTRLFQTGQKVYFQDATLTSTMSGKRWKSDTNGNVYAYFFNQKDHVGDDVTNWAEGAGKLVYGTDGAANAIYEFTVPSLPSGGDGVWWGVIFTRGTAAGWDGKWNQTTDQYPADEKSLFTIADNKDGDNWTGNWSVMPEMLCSDITDPEWSKEDGLFFTEYSGEKGIVKINCTASQSFQFIVFDGTYYKSYADETNTTWADYGPKTDGGYNFQFTAGEAGEYVFQWDKTNHKLWVWEPKARLAKQKYVYFDARNLKGSGTDYWQYSDFTARFWFKYYDSGSDKGSVDCTKASALEDWVYYALVPDDDYLGRIQMNKMNGESVACEAGLVYAKDRESLTQNCLKEESGKENWCTSWTPQWDTYCPPTTSETFADNSTETISWQPNTNDGSTSANAIWVKTGTTLKVAATASKAVADDNMTIKYDFKVNSTSQQDGTTATYTHSASTNNTTYELSADIYTNYNLDNTKNSTKHTQSSIFYKALDTYSVTHTLSGVTKASGREGADAAAYYVAYDATYTADAGYYLPSDIIVTIGGVTKTKGTDYTWTVTDGTSGVLSILTDKIDGNVVVTINGVYRWSIAGSWKIITLGEGDPYWDADTYAMGTITQVSSDYVCSVTVTLDANTNYTFKIVDRAASPYEYWGNNTITYYINYSTDMSSGWTFGNNSSNTAACGLTAAGAGTYTFTWNITQSKLKVTFPTSYYVTAAGNPAAGGTVTPSSATYMSTSVGGEITATPNYSHYFNGWTSNAGGTFTDNTAATTTFKPASADATVTAAFLERTAFIEGNFQVYNSTRTTRTKTGDSWVDDATTIKMTYDSENNRYYLHTYSTPAELAEQLNSTNAYFYVKTSASGSSIADAATYKAYSSSSQSLSEYGYSHALVTVSSSEHGFKFTGSEDGYVILYFNGTHVWYELECALSYYGGEGATGDAPAARTYYAYNSNQTAASNTYSKTGYTFDHWDTATDDSGSDYAAGATNVAMNAHEVCLHAQWTAKEYTINLANMEATTAGTESVTVTFDASTHMTASDPITKPTKTHYDFAGYWTSENTGETLDHQLIGSDGKWIKDVEGYTSHDGASNPTWVHDYPISLYAKWTEHEYTITTAVSPVGAGSISCGSSTTAKFVTASGDIKATPSAGYSFRDWGFSKVGEEDYDVYVSDGSTYSSTDATIRIKAQRDGTLTANFNANNYTVTLEDRGADEGHKGTPNVSVTYNAITNLTSAISTPEKTYYTFGGYYTGEDEGETLGTQLIDASGNWKKSVTGYTGASGDDATWVYAGNITLYAKWTETKHTVTVAVSPSSPFTTGSVTISGSEVTEVSVGKIIPTADMTAEPANAAFKFKEWQLSEHVSRDEARYSANDNPNSFFAEDDDQTITAVFQTRFGVIGSLKSSDAAGHGMPGWVWSNAVGFDVNGFTDFGEGTGKGVDFRYSTTLDPNTQYKFRIYDRIKDKAIGCAAEDVLPAEDGGGKYKNWQLSHTDDGHDVLINTTGRGTYTFHITNISNDGNYWPSIQVDRPTAYQLNLGWGYVETEDLTTVKSGNVGGTVTAVATEGGVENAIANSEWVVEGGSITFTPHPADDYVFAGWFTSSDYSTEFGNKLNPLPINSIGATVNVYAKFVEKSTIFEGDVVGHEKEWNNTENWSTGALPTINDVAIITKPVIVDITNARAKRVIIDQSSSRTGQIEIAAGKELVVAGTVRKTTDGGEYGATAEEDIVFDSSSSLGLGALVMGSHDGTNKATVNFATLSHGATDDNTSVNQYVGTPFSDATVISDWYNSWVYGIKYTNGNIGWERVQGDMDPFKGYTVISADGAGHSYWMQGTLVSSANHTCSGLNWKSGSGAENENNENLLANSWMAPIKIGAMQTTDFTNTDATVYIFNSTSESAYASGGFAGNYTTHTVGTSEGVIPAMQSFSVFTIGSSASVVLDYNKIVYAPALAGTATPVANYAPQRRAIGEETNKMHLYVHTEGGYGDMVYLLSREDFENGFENGFDGRKVFGESAAPQMYAITPDGNMAVNCVPTMEGTVLGFRKGSGDSQYIFSFDYEGLETLYLNDLKAQTSTLIDASNSYTFTAAAEDDEARFIISATPIGQMPTGITVSGERLEVSGSKKLLINDHVYIIRGGRMYSIDGCLVK